jgi:hypothetical protein
MARLKFVRKAVIFFQDDSFEGVVYKCAAQILEEPN